MSGAAEYANRLIAAYNRQDFDAIEGMIAADIDFAHFNRNFAITSRDELVGVLRNFAANYMSERHFEAPDRITEKGDTAILESWYVGTAKVDLPGFGNAGESFRLKLCSVMRFDAQGILVEWKDYG